MNTNKSEIVAEVETGEAAELRRLITTAGYLADALPRELHNYHAADDYARALGRVPCGDETRQLANHALGMARDSVRIVRNHLDKLLACVRCYLPAAYVPLEALYQARTSDVCDPRRLGAELRTVEAAANARLNALAEEPAIETLTAAQRRLWDWLTSAPQTFEAAAIHLDNTSVQTVRQHVLAIRKAGFPIESAKGHGLWRKNLRH